MFKGSGVALAGLAVPSPESSLQITELVYASMFVWLILTTPRSKLSQRKIEANRQNSSDSTGPKTLIGKKTASRNALKHGLFAAEVVNVPKECSKCHATRLWIYRARRCSGSHVLYDLKFTRRGIKRWAMRYRYNMYVCSEFALLFKVGKTPVNLALGIPSVAQRYGTRLPRHLTTEHVAILVRAVRSDTAGGRRNYAMVMLLARLGLRATEVIAMQLDDIDWRSGEVIVRGKGNRHDRVPLPPDVGEALADYIKSDRKTASRALFVTERAPHRPFKDGQVLN